MTPASSQLHGAPCMFERKVHLIQDAREEH